MAPSLLELRRDGYRPLRHPVSSLALGPRGWIQAANFAMTGTLLLAGAAGPSRAGNPATSSRGATALFGAVGAGLIGAAPQRHRSPDTTLRDGHQGHDRCCTGSDQREQHRNATAATCGTGATVTASDPCHLVETAAFGAANLPDYGENGRRVLIVPPLAKRHQLVAVTVELPSRTGGDSVTRWVKVAAFGLLAERTAASAAKGDPVTIVADDLIVEAWVATGSACAPARSPPSGCRQNLTRWDGGQGSLPSGDHQAAENRLRPQPRVLRLSRMVPARGRAN